MKHQHTICTYHLRMYTVVQLLTSAKYGSIGIIMKMYGFHFYINMHWSTAVIMMYLC